MVHILTALLLLTIPATAFGATFASGGSYALSEPPLGNTYITGGDVRIATDTPADLFVAGGSIQIGGEVAGDALLVGGTVEIKRPVAGDVRVAAGKLIVEEPIAGDLLAGGTLVTVFAPAREMTIVGATVDIHEGAHGPVTVYGGSVYLSGEFAGDVKVVASERVMLGENTIIRGTLSYNAPQEAEIPQNAQIVGDVTYTGSASFLPTAEEARRFAIAGAGVFFVVGIISSLLSVALVATLFPVFAQKVSDTALGATLRRFILLFFLGFGVLVTAPLFIMLLLVSFVGAGVAVVLGVCYLLLVVLSYLYAAVLAGSALSRGIRKRTTISWYDGVIGMLALSLIGIVPGVGSLIIFILLATSAGALILVSYRFSFIKEEQNAS